MRNSVFDSKEEEKIFKRLKSTWSRYVDIFPQVPPRNVFGYDEIMAMKEKDGAKQFLLKTSFDFVICDLITHAPLLIIEFDGLSGGFSREGKYFTKFLPDNDPYRHLKMQTKLRACERFLTPIIVVSYEECSLLKESEEMITILDVIIGSAVESGNFLKDYGKYSEMLSQAFEFGGMESAEVASMEIDFMRELSNPIKKKVLDLTKKFPFWSCPILFPQPDELGYLKGTFKLTSGIQTINQVLFTKELLSVDISIRQVEPFISDPIFLFNTLGEYCLARKTEKYLGYNSQKWHEISEKIEWSEY